VRRHSDDTRTSIATATLFRVRDLFARFRSATVALATSRHDDVPVVAIYNPPVNALSRGVPEALIAARRS
jgi:hypothetical protein